MVSGIILDAHSGVTPKSQPRGSLFRQHPDEPMSRRRAFVEAREPMAQLAATADSSSPSRRRFQIVLSRAGNSDQQQGLTGQCQPPVVQCVLEIL